MATSLTATRIFTLCIALVLQCASQQVSIESDGQNVNVVVDSNAGAVFQVDGKTVALVGDVDAVTALVGDVDSRVDDLTSVAATKVALKQLSDSAATQQDVRDTVTAFDVKVGDLQTVSSTINDTVMSVNNSAWSGIGEQQEVTVALEGRLNAVFGWKSAAVVGECTATNCTVAVYGRGFFPSSRMYNGVEIDLGDEFTYEVMVSPEGSTKSYSCPIDSVEPNFIFAQCGMIISDPPSEKFWLNVQVSEDDAPMPKFGGVTTRFQMTTEGPTVATIGTSFSFIESLTTNKLTAPIVYNATSHGNLVITFTSSDESVVAATDISTTKTSTGGSFPVQFKKFGQTTITMTLTDTVGQKAVHAMVFTYKPDWTCDPEADFKAATCVQDPIDPHWGRGNGNCIKLNDGNKAWNPNTGTHVAKFVADGHMTFEWEAKTLFSVTIQQYYANPQNWDSQTAGFDAYIKDAESDGHTFGQWIKIGSCTYGECDVDKTFGATTFDIPKQYHRTAGLKVVRSVALADVPADFTFRFTEVEFSGCN
eukprot:m.143737 g.143737  ORF g.143737 m.143737 type:complete len:535 (-) comp30332_c3_seq4:324-1928(-)